MSELQKSYVDALMHDLVRAIKSGDKPTVVAIRAELDRIAGRDAQKETRG